LAVVVSTDAEAVLVVVLAEVAYAEAVDDVIADAVLVAGAVVQAF
jgi:hypothetical protein